MKTYHYFHIPFMESHESSMVPYDVPGGHKRMLTKNVMGNVFSKVSGMILDVSCGLAES